MAGDERFPLDFSSLVPPRQPRWCLALPEGFASAAPPQLRTQAQTGPAHEILARLIAAALQDPRTRLVRQDGLQAELEQKSAVFGFRDRVTLAAIEMSPDAAAPAIYSRALLGHYDFGVNRKRVARWLDRYQAEGSAK